MLFDTFFICIGFLSIFISIAFIMESFNAKENRLFTTIIGVCIITGVFTLFYMFLKTTPYYSIKVIDSSAKFPDLLQQITSKSDLEQISSKENKIFPNICKNDKSCSKFEFPGVIKTCENIQGINIIPLYADQLGGRNAEQHKYRIRSEWYITSYFNRIHKNDEDSERYSLIKVNSNDNKPVYYFSSFSIGQTNGMNVIFNKTGKTIVEGKKPEIMALSQTELNNLISKTVSESCQFYATQNEVTNEWINSEIKK
ncbi:TPA: hypothetical protein NV714_002621 [Escherichia coli]|nr:hypothetical protein [Escherichia coli]